MAASPLARSRDVTVLELVDRLLNRGVVLSGDIVLSVADVDLVYVSLRVFLASADVALDAAIEDER
jgi:hypothetical protein